MWASTPANFERLILSSWILPTNGTSWQLIYLDLWNGRNRLLTWNCMVAHLVTLRHVLYRGASVQTLSMIYWSFVLEETDQLWCHPRTSIALRWRRPAGSPLPGTQRAQPWCLAGLHSLWMSSLRMLLQLSRTVAFQTGNPLSSCSGLAGGSWTGASPSPLWHPRCLRSCYSTSSAGWHTCPAPPHWVRSAQGQQWNAWFNDPCGCQTTRCPVRGSCPATSISWQMTHPLWQGCKWEILGGVCFLRWSGDRFRHWNHYSRLPLWWGMTGGQGRVHNVCHWDT